MTIAAPRFIPLPAEGQDGLFSQSWFPVALSDEELAGRKAEWKGPRKTQYTSGAVHKFAKLVGGARWGAVTHPGAKEESHVYMDQ